MTQYELPDGFQGMETAPKRGGRVNVVDKEGNYGTDVPQFEARWVGWAPIVPLKRKARFVVERIGVGRYSVCDVPHENYVAVLVPTESAAQRIADIYNEVMP